MALYLGYYLFVPEFSHEGHARASSGDTAVDPVMMRKAIELPERLPAGCRLQGAYVPHGMAYGEPDTTQPAIMLVETDNPADLDFISRYYQGYVSFRWTPANAVGATRAEREKSMATLTASGTTRT
jgi:hypothetical protein